MIDYIIRAADLARNGSIDAMVTCPINKLSMKKAGSEFHGHTEMIAARTGADRFVMMMSGKTLSVVLVTIHIALNQVPDSLTADKIVDTIRVTGKDLKNRFGMKTPRIAVAALNPHGGEDGLFGNEEKTIILPALEQVRNEGFDVSGPHPPDTVYVHAAAGLYDVVVSMYHDQGLIPFKLLHFKDGVNTTLGLPIIRTSVDHGTAYDIAGKGVADPSSLIEAIRLAAFQASHEKGD
jgi:4-hydroxythreonine-4-phosphate dehydrogenase